MKAMVMVVAAMLAASSRADAQDFPTADPVLRRIWTVGMDSSRVEPLAQTLMDSIGPRLTGSPELSSAQKWIQAKYESWGIPARLERYGTWRGWRRGVTHVDLVSPRLRTLEGTMLAYSPPTKGALESDVVLMPSLTTRAALDAWLPRVKGKLVLMDVVQSSCRADESFDKWATPDVRARITAERDTLRSTWRERVNAVAQHEDTLTLVLERAGAAGIIRSYWSSGWGVDKVFDAVTTRIPVVQLSCEDYGLVHRLASKGQSPRLRIVAESQSLGTVPTFNVIGEITGREKPDEYVMLSAHLDSWDGASGATDNGTGTVVMMEAMRLLKAAYPNPRRTILVGHWSGEEQGLNGSRAFAADHPEIVRGLQALFNQDNGTGRVAEISMQGLTSAGEYVARWFAQMPTQLTRGITLEIPGNPRRGGSDNASFVCAGAPGFSLSSQDYDYRNYTWHTNRDTYDKIVPENVRANAILTAMLAYLASEEPSLIPRERREMAANGDGGATQWPTCRDGQRSWK